MRFRLRDYEWRQDRDGNWQRRQWPQIDHVLDPDISHWRRIRLMHVRKRLQIGRSAKLGPSADPFPHVGCGPDPFDWQAARWRLEVKLNARGN